VKEREARTRVKCLVKFPNALYQPQARVEGRDTKAPLGIIAGRKEGTLWCFHRFHSDACLDEDENNECIFLNELSSCWRLRTTL
jgi:hypothetical protein